MANSSGVGGTYMGVDYQEYLNDQRVRKTQLGKNDFLNLMMAQMQYQNPLEPMSDTDFIAQLAQFSALEQMEATSSAMASMQAFNLVGKLVCATNVICEDGQTRDIPGYVETVIYRNGEYLAKIGDYFVAVNKITEVYDEGSVNKDNPLVSNAHLLGSTVSAYAVDSSGNIIYEQGEPILDAAGQPVLDKDGNPTYKQGAAKVVSGVVTGLSIENNAMVAYLTAEDGSKYTVSVGHIFDIRQTGSASTPTGDLQALLESLLAGQKVTNSPTDSTDPTDPTDPTAPIKPPPTETEPNDDDDNDGPGDADGGETAI